MHLQFLIVAGGFDGNVDLDSTEEKNIIVQLENIIVQYKRIKKSSIK